jgi:DNA-binding CsgD family transcriptional regulator
MTDITQLSERELEILQLLATGASNKEIARKLVISINTVKVHLRNIYAKLEVASRTEATLFAMRAGLVRTQLEGSELSEPDLQSEKDGETQPTPEIKVVPLHRRLWFWAAVSVVVGLVIAILFWAVHSQQQPVEQTSVPIAVEQAAIEDQRWNVRASLLSPRSNFAAVAYENQLYAIAGETPEGITNSVERYDPEVDSWVSLSLKEIPVADVQAVTVGGLIYVPGGRLSNGDLTDIVEVYDPLEDQWERRASLPVPLSAYSLVAYEGRIYLFGGWDGQTYVDSVYQYVPSEDRWEQGTSMPTARGFSGAGVAGGRIFVFGGENEAGVLAANEEYRPESDVEGGSPWTSKAGLPEGRSGMGVTSIGEILHIIGGDDNGETGFSALRFFPQNDIWEEFDSFDDSVYTRMGVAVIHQDLYLCGGMLNGEITSRNLSYRAMYIVVIPVIR